MSETNTNFIPDNQFKKLRTALSFKNINDMITGKGRPNRLQKLKSKIYSIVNLSTSKKISEIYNLDFNPKIKERIEIVENLGNPQNANQLEIYAEYLGDTISAVPLDIKTTFFPELVIKELAQEQQAQEEQKEEDEEKEEEKEEEQDMTQVLDNFNRWFDDFFRNESATQLNQQLETIRNDLTPEELNQLATKIQSVVRGEQLRKKKRIKKLQISKEVSKPAEQDPSIKTAQPKIRGRKPKQENIPILKLPKLQEGDDDIRELLEIMNTVARRQQQPPKQDKPKKPKPSQEAEPPQPTPSLEDIQEADTSTSTLATRQPQTQKQKRLRRPKKPSDSEIVEPPILQDDEEIQQEEKIELQVSKPIKRDQAKQPQDKQKKQTKVKDPEIVEPPDLRDEEDSNMGLPDSLALPKNLKKQNKNKVTDIGDLDIPSSVDLIPPQRLNSDDKTLEQLLDDIDYFYKNFPERLRKIKKTTSKNILIVRRLHKRIVASLKGGEKTQQEKKNIGIIIKGSDFIKDKLKEIILENSIDGLSAKDLLINIEGDPSKQKTDAGNYEFKTNLTSGKTYAEGQPIYRYIPTSDPEEVEKNKATYKKPISRIQPLKTKFRSPVETAKMKVAKNPFLNANQPKIRFKSIY